MADPTLRRRNGFTLIEVLISLAIFLMVFMGIYQVFDANRMTYHTGQMKLDAQQTARLALNEIVRRLRMAGYFPENFSATPPSPLLANPLQVATDSALAIYGDAEGSGVSTVFVFCRDAGNVLRRVTGPPTQDATFACANGELMAENITALAFTYYDGNGDPIPSPPNAPFQLDNQNLNGAVPSFGTTTQRSAVRSIMVSLTAEQTSPGQRTQSYTVTSTVRLRNVN